MPACHYVPLVACLPFPRRIHFTKASSSPSPAVAAAAAPTRSPSLPAVAVLCCSVCYQISGALSFLVLPSLACSLSIFSASPDSQSPRISALLPHRHFHVNRAPLSLSRALAFSSSLLLLHFVFALATVIPTFLHKGTVRYRVGAALSPRFCKCLQFQTPTSYTA